MSYSANRDASEYGWIIGDDGETQAAPVQGPPTFNCGHPRDADNSYHMKSQSRVICLTCKRRNAQQSAQRNYRARYLKKALPRQEQKLAAMRKEAKQLGVT